LLKRFPGSEVRGQDHIETFRGCDAGVDLYVMVYVSSNWQLLSEMLV